MSKTHLAAEEINNVLSALYIAEKALLDLHNTCVQVKSDRLYLDQEFAEITSIWYEDLQKLIKKIQLYSSNPSS